MQWGHLNVVVPPDILNEADTNGSSLDESVTNEGGQIQLVCIATGVPEPTVSERCNLFNKPMLFRKISVPLVRLFFFLRHLFELFSFKCLVRMKTISSVYCSRVYTSSRGGKGKKTLTARPREHNVGPHINYFKLNSDLS